MVLNLQLPSSAIFFAFFIFILFMVANIFWRSKTKNSDTKLPPGPKKLPLIGNIHQLGALPHRSLAKLAKQYGALMHIQLGQLSCVVISSPEMAKEVMKTHDIIFAYRPLLLAADIITYGSKGITLSPCGAYWRQMRKICTMELLAAKRVESFRSIREEELSNLVKEISLSERSTINLSEKISSLTYGLTSRTALGGKCKDQQAYIELMKDFSKIAAGFSVADLYPSIEILQVLTGFRSKVEMLHQEIDRILENVVTDHKDRRNLGKGAAHEEADEDLVDVLLKLQNQNNLDHPLSFKGKRDGIQQRVK